MIRNSHCNRALVWSCILPALAAWGCGGDDDSSQIDGFGGASGSNGQGAQSGGSVIQFGGAGSGGGSSGGTGGGDSSCSSKLTGLVRDFKASEEPGGHPDFEAFAGTRPATGIVRAALGADKKPVYAATGPVSTREGQQTTSQARFDEWYRNVDGLNEAIELTLPLTAGSGGISTYENREFFPIDDRGFGNYEPYMNGLHNYHFTFELHTEFSYVGGEEFTFIGDDDLWVFINGRLAIDLGGLHSELTDAVSLDDIADEFGLVRGSTYALDLFHAERHTNHSRFRIDTSIQFTNCNPIIIPR